MNYLELNLTQQECFKIYISKILLIIELGNNKGDKGNVKRLFLVHVVANQSLTNNLETLRTIKIAKSYVQ